MRTARPFDRSVGVVVSFDAAVGLGVVEAGGRRLTVHCTQIDGGARRLAPGTPVEVAVGAGHAGRWEAMDVRGAPGAFLCPVCGASVAGESGTYEICDVCGWEDDPASRDDPAARGGANVGSLDDARRAWREANP